MVKSTFVKGQQGEADAARYLEAQGYQIVARNWRIVGGEIDLIARQGDEWVFIEVRSRSQKDSAFASILPRKQATLIRAVERYLAEHQLDDARWRIDGIAVTRTQVKNATPEIDHVQNIFDW